MGSCSTKFNKKLVTSPVSKAEPCDMKISAQTFITKNFDRFSNKYKIGKALGAGSFGEVRIVMEKITGHQRAAKIFRKSLYPPKKVLNEMKNEIEILKNIDHPNVIKIYEYFEDTKATYVVMEKCEGGELYSQIIKHNKFSEYNAALIMKQLLSAVAYLHENRIVHRDIKPENILFDSDNDLSNIKLIDFGLAQLFKKGEFFNKTVGSLYYIAPEVLNENYNEKCDLWSCGVIAYMMLCGEPPFSGKNDEEILEKIKKKSLSFHQQCWEIHSVDSKDFIMKMLCEENQRFSAKEILQHSWIQFFNIQSPHNEIYVPVLESLRKFHSTNKLSEAIRLYISYQYLAIEDSIKLKSLFKEIDTNSDGKISKTELLEFYNKSMGVDFSEEEIDKIMAEVDSNGNGFIDYSEFIEATANEKIFMNDDYLRIAFDKFDIDKSGKISASEIRQVLHQTEENEKMCSELVKLVDQNSDGEIDFKEFLNIFHKH